jgi:hypothetical protein
MVGMMKSGNEWGGGNRLCIDEYGTLWEGAPGESGSRVVGDAIFREEDGSGVVATIDLVEGVRITRARSIQPGFWRL